MLVAVVSLTACDMLVLGELESIRGQIEEINTRLDELCQETNSNIAALQVIVAALEDRDYVEDVSEIYDDGVIVGYTITFAQKGKISIFNGKDGKDGQDGTDGKDAVAPMISVCLAEDGLWYWQLNGEWLLDQNGNKIRASGKDGQDGTDGKDGEDGVDGITPQLKIEDGDWYISYDNGVSWTYVGQATGKDGADGEDADISDSIFSDIIIDETSVHFILNNGEEIIINKAASLKIVFEETSDITCQPGITVRIAYKLTGADNKTELSCLAEQGWMAKIEQRDMTSGYLAVTAPNPMTDGKVLVFVTSGTGHTIMASLTFIEGKPMIDSNQFYVECQGGNLEVSIRTKEDYIVRISSATPWITNITELTPETKAAERIDKLLLHIAANHYESGRTGSVELVNTRGELLESFTINQYGDISESAWIEFRDPSVKSICINNFDTNKDGELSLMEARSVTSLERIFYGTGIRTFDELQFFTGLQSIGEKAFYNCSSLISTKLPDSLVSIGSYAFYKTALHKIVIPEGVKDLQSYCFSSCNDLAFIVLPDSLQEIGMHCFSWCKSLVEISIPDGVIEIGNYMFSNCTSLSKVELSQNLIIVGSYAFEYCSSLKGLDLPASVYSIGSSAFKYSGIESFVAPESLIKIQDCVFYHCEYLKKLILHDAITEIATSAFAYSAIESFVLPPKVTSVPDHMLSGCSSLENLSLHEDVKRIGPAAFEYCEALTSFTLPSKVTGVSENMLRGCSSLENLTLHANVTSIGTHAFEDCVSLKSFALPSKVTGVPVYMLRGCSSLENLTLHNNVASIGADAFENCESLTSFTLPLKVTSVSSYILKGCRSLKTLTLHSNVTSIGTHAFEDCESLETFTLPLKVTGVPAYMLSGCHSLKTLTLHDDVKSIGSYAFSTCDSLSTVTVPDKVKSIESYVFSGCTNLKSLSLGLGVTSVTETSLQDCISLNELILKPLAPPSIQTKMLFYYAQPTLQIKVPKESLEAYKTAAVWSEVADKIVPISE